MTVKLALFLAIQINDIMSHLPLGQSRDIMLELRDIRNQYSALVPPRLIAFPPATALASLESQTYLLSNLLGESRFPQPEDGYRRLFWRMILRYLELGLETAHAEKGRDEGHMVEDEEDDVDLSTLAGQTMRANHSGSGNR